MEIFMGILGAILGSIIFIIFIILELLPIVIPILFWYYIFKTIFQAIKRSSNQHYFKNNIVVTPKSSAKKNIYIDISKDQLALFNTDDIDGLKDYFYDMFYRFEVAYNNLDYNIMRSLATKQLYQNYYTGISLALKAGRKRIIEDIERVNVIIYEIDSTLAKQVLLAMIEISYKNYVVDKNGNVITGRREEKIRERFEVTFRKDFERQTVSKCPNCGASITGNKCEYCRTVLQDVEFRISNIKRIVEE